MAKQRADESMKAVVRTASPADAETVGGLLFDFNTEFETPTPPAAVFAVRFGQLLARADVLVLLAEDMGTPVGFAYLTLRPTPYGDGPIAQLEEFYVRPGRRGRGVGAALITEALARVGERRAIELQISVDEVDSDARRFYERHGFVNVEPGTESRMLCHLREL